jgi:hypothetical protein
MAQSIVTQPQAVMGALAREYQIADEGEIRAFLERYPDVAPLLFDIRSNIRRYFGEDAVRLDMSFDLEWPEQEPDLVVNILTPFRAHEALDRLHKFDRDWWLAKLGETRAPLIVSVLPIRRV